MQIQVDIGFDELLEVVMKLPEDQFSRFKKELDNKEVSSKKSDVKTNSEDIEAFLLSGPTFSEEQIKIIEETQKAVNRWRIK